MQRLLLGSIVLFAHVASGQPFDRAQPRDGMLADFAQPTSGEASPVQPLPHLATNEPTRRPNAPLRLGQESGTATGVDSTYVAPATATSPLASTNTQEAEPSETRDPLRLSRPSDGEVDSQSGRKSPPSASGTIVNIVSSLAIVLGLFFLTVWFIRRGTTGAGGALPSDVVQVLGRSQLSQKQQLQLIRVGGKLVLVAVSASGAQTLTEVTNASEVERLATACEASRGGSASESFRQVLSQLGNQPAIGGFFGGDSAGTQREEESHA